MEKNEDQLGTQPNQEDKTHFQFKDSFHHNRGQINIGGTVHNVVEKINNTFKTHPIYSILSVVGIFTIIILMIAFFAPPGETEAAETIRNFENAIATENTSALEDLLSVDDNDMKIKEEYLNQFIRYAKEKPKYLEETLQIMNAQKALYEDEGYNADLLDKNSPDQVLQAGEFYLKRESGLFSDSFSIGVRPQYVEITLENDNGIIELDGEELMRVSKDKHTIKSGPLFPGDHQVVLKTYFDYADKTITESDSISLFGMESVDKKTYYLTGEAVQIDSDFNGVQVYLNDKPTPFIFPTSTLLPTPNVTSLSLDENYFYPAVRDGTQTIQGVAKFPWGESRSKKFTIGSDRIDLTPPLQERAKQEALSVIKPFLESRIQAVMKKDVNAVRRIIPSSKETIKERLEEDMGGECRIVDFASRHKGVKSAKIIDYSLDEDNDYEVSYNPKTKKHEIELKITVYYELVGNDGYAELDKNSLSGGNWEEMTMWVTFDQGEWKVVDYGDVLSM